MKELRHSSKKARTPISWNMKARVVVPPFCRKPKRQERPNRHKAPSEYDLLREDLAPGPCFLRAIDSLARACSARLRRPVAIRPDRRRVPVLANLCSIPYRFGS